MRIRLWSILVTALAAACAVEAPPPGGPVDETPPRVLSTLPTSDSAGVDPSSEIGITFSEDMTRTGVERQIQLQPPIEIGKVRWKGRTILIRPLEPLHPDTTYYVTLRAGFRDNHRVGSETDLAWAFATSTAIDSGTISGTIHFRREPTQNGVVRAFVLPADSGFTPEAARPDREAVTNEDGHYSLRYLSNRGTRYVVWAFEDANRNGVFAPGDEAGMVYQDTIILSPEVAFAEGKDILIIDPKEPAVVSGVVVNRSGLDTLAISVALYADTVAAPKYMTRCDTTGFYEFKTVMMGSYALRAFVDVVPDSVCGWFPCAGDSSRQCAEPCVLYPDSVSVMPGDEASLDTLWLEPAATREE